MYSLQMQRVSEKEHAVFFTKSMTRRFLAPGILVVFAVLLVLAGCGGAASANNNPTATTPPAPTATTAPAPTATTAAATPVNSTQVAIAIQNFSFNPQTITIKTGTTVTWTDKDTTPHTVTSDSGAPASFNSGPLAAPGGTFKFTFTQAGTYTYHCMIHPSMTATIVVVAS